MAYPDKSRKAYGAVSVSAANTGVADTNTQLVAVNAELDAQTTHLSNIETAVNSGLFVTTNHSVDMFSRLRVSNPQTVFDSKQLKDKQPLFWDDVQVSGTGTSSTYNTNQSSTTISVSASTAGMRARQTFRRFNYQPGKSQLVFLTGVIGAGATGIVGRIGQFDERNGLFFEIISSGIGVVRRTYTSGSVFEARAAQTAWNGDKLDGTGQSGVTIDWSKAQIFWIAYEWLGVGSVAFGVVHHAQLITCHTMHHNNDLTTVYMSSPNLPLRYEVSNDGAGAAASLVHICSTVISEGGVVDLGAQRGLTRGATAMTTSNNANIYGLIALRIQSGFEAAHIHIANISVVCTTTSAYNWYMIMNPTASATPTFTPVSNSAVEANVGMTATTLTGGTVIMCGTSLQTNDGGTNIVAPQDIALGVSLVGVSDVVYLAVQRVTGTSETFYASLNYREII